MERSGSATARERLDARLATLKPIDRFQAPTKGWVRAIRDALAMSGAQLGKRLGVKAQSIADLEKSEVQGTIQLNTLRRAAEAMDCVVVYALVPRSTLVETVETRAREIARKEIARISHTMDLEAQGLSKTDREAQIDAYMRNHLRSRDLWEET
ncbi:MAG: mobile mystery protein A [Pseudomonadota bacterium]